MRLRVCLKEGIHVSHISTYQHAISCHDMNISYLFVPVLCLRMSLKCWTARLSRMFLLHFFGPTTMPRRVSNHDAMNLLQNFCQLCQKVPTVSMQSRQTSNACIYHGQFTSPLDSIPPPSKYPIHLTTTPVTTAYHDFYPHTHHISSASPIRPYPLLRKHVTWKS